MTVPSAPTRESLLENWSRLGRDERPEFFRSLPHDDAADLFFSLTTWDQAELLDSLPERERRFWLRALAPDDAADVVQHFPEEERAAYLEMLDEVTRREVKALLAYQEDAAGGLMSPRFVRLRPEMTVDEAIAYVRRQASQVDSIHYAYVLDGQQRLLGVLGFRDLLAAAPNQLVRDVMRTEFVAVTEEVDQERLARLFEDWRLVAIPVVDAEGRMRGIVTVDDIVDAVEEEATEDIQKFGGSAALEGPYLEVGFRQMIRKRAGWLAVLFLGESFTATAMAYFEEEIARAVVLAMFIPLIISSGGNSGSQAATLVIRAMALGEVGLRDWWRILRRELGSGLALGAVLGAIGFARIVLWQLVGHVYGEHYLLVALTVAVSLIGVVLFGTITGSMLPIILRRLGFDPASASAPFVATLVDVTGVVIYFTVAAVILRGTLL
jgi:magnesium transporter